MIRIITKKVSGLLGISLFLILVSTFCQQEIICRFRRTIDNSLEKNTRKQKVKTPLKIKEKVPTLIKEVKDLETITHQKKIIDEPMTDWKITSTADFSVILNKIEDVVVTGESDLEMKRQFKEGFEKQRQKFKKAIIMATEPAEIANLTIPFESIWESYQLAEPYFNELSESKQLSKNERKQARSELISQLYSNIFAQAKDNPENSFLEKTIISEEISRSLVDHIVLHKPLPEKKIVQAVEHKEEPAVDISKNIKTQEGLELEIKVAKLTADLQAFESVRQELEAFKNESEENNKKIKESAEKLQQTETEREILKAKLTSREQSLKQKELAANQKINALKQQIDELKKQSKKTFDEKILLQTNFEKNINEAAIVKTLAHSNEERYQAAEQKNKKLSGLIESTSQEKLSVELKNKTLETEMISLGKKNSLLEETIATKERELAILREKTKSNDEKLIIANSESLDLKSKIEKNKNETSNFLEKIKWLEKDLQLRSQESITAQIKMNQILFSKENLEKKMLELSQEKFDLEQTKKFLENDLSDQIKKINQKNKVVSKLESKKDRLENKIYKLKRRVEEIAENGSSNTEKSQKETERINKELDELKTKLETASQELEKSNFEKNQLAIDLKSLEVAGIEKTNLLKTLKCDHEKTTSQIQALDQKFQNKESKMMESVAKKKDLEQKIDQQKTILNIADNKIKSLEVLVNSNHEKIQDLHENKESLLKESSNLKKEMEEINKESMIKEPKKLKPLPSLPKISSSNNETTKLDYQEALSNEIKKLLSEKK